MRLSCKGAGKTGKVVGEAMYLDAPARRAQRIDRSSRFCMLNAGPGVLAFAYGADTVAFAAHHAAKVIRVGRLLGPHVGNALR